VGAEEALHEGVKQVWAEEMAGRLLAMTGEQWGAEMGRAEGAVGGAAARVMAGQARLAQVGWGWGFGGWVFRT